MLAHAKMLLKYTYI